MSQIFKVTLYVTLDEYNNLTYKEHLEENVGADAESYVKHEMNWVHDSFDNIQVNEVREIYLPESELPTVNSMGSWIMSLNLDTVKTLFKNLLPLEAGSSFQHFDLTFLNAFTQKYTYFRMGLEDPSTYSDWRVILDRYYLDKKGTPHAKAE